jgi:predicted O-linked N-acetylglucosamine transferase (SPINDLY family)
MSQQQQQPQPLTLDEAVQAALQRHRLGHLQQAETIYRQVLAADPNHADALHLLGVLAHQVGHHAPAVEMISRAAQLKPNVAEIRSNLGEAFRASGAFDRAEASYRAAIAIDAGFIDAYNNLGSMRLSQNRVDEAIEVFQAAIARNPRHAGAQSNLGIALAQQQRLDEAIAAFETALSIQPDYAEASNNLALALFTQGRFEDAIAFLQRALTLAPHYADAHNNLGQVLQATGLVAEAIAALRRAVELAPAWAVAHSNLLLPLHYAPGLSRQQVFEEHLEWSRRHAEPLARAVPDVPHASGRDPDRRLRVGYLSPDWRTHSVAFFMEPILIGHDRAAVEVFCYSDTRAVDESTARLRTRPDHWREVAALSDEQLAEQVRRDRIDVLVDLSGHTAGNRLLLFARRPAPVQVTYLAYPDTTGLREIGYRITDAIADPAEDGDPFHAERLVRLARCAWTYRPLDASPDVNAPPSQQSGVITFGSFNTLPKVSSATVALWAKVLAATPGSRLVLKSAALSEPSVRAQTAQRFAAAADHLRAYHQIDIALDTFPYHGTTTTCDALWMGVPVVTLAGDRHVSRVGASLLNAVGLDELIATSPDAFIEIATDLASNRPRLEDIRANLRDRMRRSPLTDGRSLAAAMEQAYRRMWHEWCGAATPS